MNKKDFFIDIVIISMSASFLWHFSNIWHHGQHLIGEPNIVILSVETAGLVFILVFGVLKCISDLKGDRDVSQDRVRNIQEGKNVQHIQK